MARLQDFSTVTPSGSDNLLIVQSQGQGLATLNTVIGPKMDKAAPTGTGALSLNRKANTTVGTNSVATGGGITASGPYSFATGYNTTASSDEAFAEGSGTTASGQYGSHAEGLRTTASGAASHAEGLDGTAAGNNSHAEGNNCTASGASSHAEGNNCTASGASSHAEGNGNSVDGTGSHAEGYSNTASGIACHVEGRANTITDSNYGHCEGYSNTVTGGGAHVEGTGVTASGQFCHAEGRFTIANHRAQHVFGEYNVADTSTAAIDSRGSYVEIVGKGTSDSARSNARTLDWSGNETIAGTLTQSSDASLKDVLEEDLPDVSGIKAVKFKWKEDAGRDDSEHVGYLAQDVEKVMPYLVKEDAEGNKVLDYIAFLVAKIDSLEKRLDELEG